MATTVSAFNDMMQQFLDELVLTFPEEKSFVKFQASFSLIRKTRPRMVLENYMKSIEICVEIGSFEYGEEFDKP